MIRGTMLIFHEHTANQWYLVGEELFDFKAINCIRTAPTRNVTVSGPGQSHLPLSCGLSGRKAWHSPFLMVTELWQQCLAESGCPFLSKPTPKQGNPQWPGLGSAPREMREHRKGAVPRRAGRGHSQRVGLRAPSTYGWQGAARPKLPFYFHQMCANTFFVHGEISLIKTFSIAGPWTTVLGGSGGGRFWLVSCTCLLCTMMALTRESRPACSSCCSHH